MRLKINVDFKCPCCDQVSDLEVEFERVPGGLANDEDSLKITRAWNCDRPEKKPLTDFGIAYLQQDEAVMLACGEAANEQNGQEPT